LKGGNYGAPTVSVLGSDIKGHLPHGIHSKHKWISETSLEAPAALLAQAGSCPRIGSSHVT